MEQNVHEQTTAYKLLHRIYESGCTVTPDIQQEIEKLFKPAELSQGQRIRHKSTGKCGVVRQLSRSGRRALVLWDGREWADGYTKIEMLEAVE